MPVERIDVQVQSLISGANLDTQKKVDQEDEADHARKVAEKKIAEKKELLKESGVQREVLQRQSDLHNRMRSIMGGAAGRDSVSLGFAIDKTQGRWRPGRERLAARWFGPLEKPPADDQLLGLPGGHLLERVVVGGRHIAS